MNITTNRNKSTRVLERVPVTVFLFLGVNRQDAHSMGMIGCGLQLDDSGDFSWGDTTVSLDLSLPQVCVFLKTKRIDFSVLPEKSNITRVPIKTMVDYVSSYETVLSFLENFRKNRFLRLGHRALLDPWDLDSRDSFMLRLSEEEFSSSFIADPRGPPLLSEITSRTGRLSPKQFRPVPGLPDPGVGSWI
jgi:hypothetical protein